MGQKRRDCKPAPYNPAMPELSQDAAGVAVDQRPIELVIMGITVAGQVFRPSDWAERLCGVMSAFGGDHRMQYSPYVYPISAAGLRCVVVDLRLEGLEPMAYRFLLSFARDNELRTREGRVEERTLLAQLSRGEDQAVPARTDRQAGSAGG
jgi:hypothetical protein